MGYLVEKIASMLEFSKNKQMTETGKPADDIEVHHTVKEMAFTFGRFNPPTAAHGKLIEAVARNNDHMIYVSHSHDSKKNPILAEEKIAFIKAAYPDVNISENNVKDIFGAALDLSNKGYDSIVMYVGEDRVEEFKHKLNEYNGKLYNFKSIRVESVGFRDLDSDGDSGISASKLRSYARNGYFLSFKEQCISENLAEDIYNATRKGMNLSEGVSVSRAAELLRQKSQKRQEDLKKQQAQDVEASKEEDAQGQTIARKGKTLETEEINRPVIPNARNTGKGPVDIGYDKDLEKQDKNKILKHRQGVKLFRYNDVVEETNMNISEAKKIHRLTYDPKRKQWLRSETGGFTWKVVGEDEAKRLHPARYAQLKQDHASE